LAVNAKPTPFIVKKLFAQTLLTVWDQLFPIPLSVQIPTTANNKAHPPNKGMGFIGCPSWIHLELILRIDGQANFSFKS